MAVSPFRSKAFPINRRSLSLPSKLQNPAVSEFSSSKTTTSLSVENLKTLYRNVENLLMLPHTQQIISQQRHEKWVNNQLLDAYIKLLDACTAAREIVSQTKNDVQQLLSALRRKDSEGIQRYQASRKRSRRAIQKALRELKTGFKRPKQKEQENDTLAVLCMRMKEAESVTITTFEILLSYVIMDKESAQPARQSGWASLVWKRSTEVEIDSSWLEDMESSIRVVEGELEGLFQQLIKTRVSLLNIINH